MNIFNQNQEEIKQISDLFHSISNSLQQYSIQTNFSELKNLFEEYVSYISDKIIVIDESECLEERIKNHENIIDKLQETIKQKEDILTKVVEMDKIVKQLNNFTDKMKQLCENIDEMKQFNDKCIATMEELEKKQYEMKINERKKFVYNKKQFDEEDQKKKQKQEGIYLLDIPQRNKIEEWSNKKFGEVIFHSDVDDWNQNTSIFDKLIFNKNQLLFIIQTEDGIKFGGYINSLIDKYRDQTDDSTIISDPNAFLFTFRENKQQKFDIKEEHSKTAFYLYPKEHERLFWIGTIDIGIRKKNDQCQCGEGLKSFENNYQQNSLIGRSGKRCFTATKIVVCQMK